MTTDTVAVELATLSAQTLTATTLLHGIITIKWPFSPSLQRLTFLLADPDPRRRAGGGQVKITLLGEAAEFVDRIGSGEEISLTAGGQKCEAVEEAGGRAGRGQWHITFSNGCQVTTKDSTVKQFGPPTAPAPIVIPPLPRIPPPPPPARVASPRQGPGVWKAPLKRKFEELTDHSITSILTEEEEWFGSQPRLPSSNENSRRFSGRMRFLNPDGTSSPSTPASKPVNDENSFDAALLSSEQQQVPTAAPRQSSPTRRVVSPSVLRAQNLVAAEILSEKILHPPRSVGTGVDDVSHAAVDEGGSRRTAPSEKSFEVFMDETDVLPKELTASMRGGESQIAVKEGLQTVSHDERQGEQEGEDYESQDEEPRHEEDEVEQSEEPEYEEDEDDLQPYHASEHIPQLTERLYRSGASASVSEEQEDTWVDHRFSADDKEGDRHKGKGKEEDELLPGRYYRDRKPELEDEYVHSDEEIEEDEFEESELESEESGGRMSEPVVVDLTFDSDDEHEKLVMPREYDEYDELEDHEEESELEEMDDEDEEDEDEEEDEEEEEDGEEDDEEEEGEEDYNEESSWQGIQSATPFTDTSRQSRHHSPALISQSLGSIFNQDIPPILETTSLGTTMVDPHTNDFTHPPPQSDPPQPSLSLPSTNILSSYTQDLIAQTLDPAIFQSFSPITTDLPAHVLPEEVTRLLDSILYIPQPADSLQQPFPLQMSALEAGQQAMEIVDFAGEQEFLTRLMPMGDKESMKEDTAEESQHVQQLEFLATIAPQVLLPASEEIKTRTEPTSEQSIALGPSSPSHEPPPQIKYKQPTPPVERAHSPTPPPLPENWNKDGLTTPLGYYPSLTSIRAPTLREQKAHLSVDAIGIIRSLVEIRKTKGPDFLLSLFLVDPSTGPEQGVSTQLFRPYLDGLPRTAKVGNVLLLTNMKVQSFKHRGQIRSTESSGWAFFDDEGNMVEEGPPVEVGRHEKEMVRYLRHWWRKAEGKPAEENFADASQQRGGHEHVGAQAVENGVVNAHTESPRRDAVHKMKHRPRRGGRVVNLNR